jgi:hypothetical protein
MQDDIEIADQIFTMTRDLPDEELAEFAAGIFKSKWKTSYDYQSRDPISFKSLPIDEKILKHTDFMSSAVYISDLTEKALKYRWNEMKGLAGKELKAWDANGGLCIYLSILHFCLLLESKAVKEDELCMVQGFYRHPTHGILSLIANLATQCGVHAFISVQGAVVDFSIQQEASTFEFGENEFIIGDIPDEMEMVGWTEGKHLVKQYAREIARSSGLNYFEWIEQHRMNSYKMARDKLEEELIKLKSLYKSLGE